MRGRSTEKDKQSQSRVNESDKARSQTKSLLMNLYAGVSSENANTAQWSTCCMLHKDRLYQKPKYRETEKPIKNAVIKTIK